MIHVGILVPLQPGAPRGTPEQMPIGRVALHLADEGIALVFARDARGGVVSGFVAEPGRWRPASDVAVVGAYDRYPSKQDPHVHDALREGLAGLPLVNPASFTLLCRDKLACQRHLEAGGIGVPTVEADPSRFAERLAAWGAGFLKPRYGAFGVGVRRVVPGDPLTASSPGTLGGPPEPTLLQRAVPPPAGWAGISVRVLVQRQPGGDWVTNAPVVRRHRSDPVVNVARGAAALPAADVLAADTLAAVHATGLHVARVMSHHPDGALLAEIGVDLAIDAGGVPRPIEVNSRPRGRLESLAAVDPDRFARAHLEACARPVRFVAAIAGDARR